MAAITYAPCQSIPGLTEKLRVHVVSLHPQWLGSEGDGYRGSYYYSTVAYSSFYPIIHR
jgi:hypothetical protein